MSQPTTVNTGGNLLGNLKITAQQIRSACLDAPSGNQEMTVARSADAIVAACVAMQQAQVAAATGMSNPVYSPGERAKQGSAAIRGAVKTVRDAADELEQAADKTRTSLEAALLPKLPAGTSEAAVFSRLEQLTKIVEDFQGTPSDKIESIKKLLQNALQSEDQLSSYVICHEMRYVFLHIGLNWTAVLQALVKAIGRATSDDNQPTPGAALLALLQRGGPGTIGELTDASRYLAVKAEQDWAEYLRRSNPNLYSFQK
jgi:hypothetical protein